MRYNHFMGILLFAVVLPGPASAQQAEGVTAIERGLLLDFQDAELRLVISALAEAGGLNVVYSDVPSKRITLRMSQPVPRQNLLALLRSVVASNGLLLIEEEGFIRIEGGGARVGPQQWDVGSEAEGSESRLFVHRLRHARADRMATTLQSVFGVGPRSAPRGAAASQPTLSQQLRGHRIAPTDLDSPPRVVVELGTAAPSLPGQLQGEVQIVPDESTNSLLVRAQAADWAVIRQAIEALDLRPLQVLIEGRIVEVRRTREQDVGVTVRGSDRSATQNRALGGELRGRTTGEMVLQVLTVGGLDLDVTLSALASSGSVRLLSHPVLLAQNNQEARILIGAQRPFIQVFRSLPTDGAVRDQVVQYRDVGTSLTIRPTINPDGYVNLQVTQEVSTATSETQFGAPVISTREASTHLFVRDGQTIVIGGLVDRQRDLTRTGVPLLKDIPLLGMLFGATRDATTHSELFLFLTPHIIASDADADRVTDGVETAAPSLRGRVGTILPSERAQSNAPTPGGPPASSDPVDDIAPPSHDPR
jgi:type II secretory pathway component GspD/PulD (secretin)